MTFVITMSLALLIVLSAAFSLDGEKFIWRQFICSLAVGLIMLYLGYLIGTGAGQ